MGEKRPPYDPEAAFQQIRATGEAIIEEARRRRESGEPPQDLLEGPAGKIECSMRRWTPEAEDDLQEALAEAEAMTSECRNCAHWSRLTQYRNLGECPIRGTITVETEVCRFYETALAKAKPGPDLGSSEAVLNILADNDHL